MEKTILKIWDKIYAKHSNYLNGYSYVFDEIERVTKTLIITKEGRRLKNNWDSCVEKTNIRYQWNRVFELVTDEILKDNERIENINKIEGWFYNKKFTIEEKKIIYDLLKNNLLTK